MRFSLPSIPLATTLLLVAVPNALAADGESTPLNLKDAGDASATTAAGGGGGGALVRTLIGLVVVIGVIYGVAWVLKQVKASKDTASAGQGLESVASLALGGDKAVHLLRAGNELVLVGVGEHGVTHLRTYSAAEAQQLGLQAPPAHAVLEAAPADRRGSLIQQLRDKTVLR